MGGSGKDQPAAAPQAAAKKPAGEAHAHAPVPAAPSGGKRAPVQAPGACLSWGCKTEATRFGFCGEHYEHFKFGLIKKTGEPVPDYEKKIEHYAAYRDRAKKVA